VPSSADFSSEEILDEIISLTVQFEDQYKQAFYRSIEESIADPALLELLQDISDGTVIDMTPQVEDVLRNLNVPVDELIDVLRDAMMRVGQVTADTIGLEIAFDMTNPRAAQYAATLGARSINASEAVRQSIREIVKQVVEGEMSIQNAKRLIKERAGLLPQHSQAVARYYDNLVASGSTARRARELANQYANRLLNYRADMIARTEIGAAQSYGQWELWQQARDANLVPLDAMRIWMTAKDERVCDVCGPMNGQVASIDGVWFTPNGPVHYPTEIHPNCRCASGLIFSRGRAREFMNKSADLGYEYWLLEKHLGTQHDQKTHGRRKISSFVTFGPEYRDWVKGRAGANYPSGYYDEGHWEDSFESADDRVTSGLKDDVARSIGADILAEMSTGEILDAVRSIASSAGHASRMDTLVRAQNGRYELDLVSRVALLSTRPATNDGSPHADSALVRALEAKGLRIRLDSELGQVVVDSEGNLVTSATVTVSELVRELVRPSEWVLEKGRSVLGSDHPQVKELEESIRITTKVFASDDENILGKRDYGTFGVRYDTRKLERWPTSRALHVSTVNAFAKTVDALISEGEHNRKEAADFITSASEEAGVEVLSNQIRLSYPQTIWRASEEALGYGEPEGLANEVASALISGWSNSSSSPESVLMMQAAVTELGASAGYSPEDYTLGRSSNPRLEDLSPAANKLIKTAVRSQYDSTQEMYRDMGISEVTIARGMTFPLGSLPFERERDKSVYEAQAVLRPLSSWSIDATDALAFAKGAQVLFQTVPVERIFATPFTGLGCFGESETIFIHKDGDVFPIVDLTSLGGATTPELAEIINDYPELPKISKASLPTVYPDADIRDADWPKRTFDFPDVTTAKQYRERFGLQDDEALAEHIKEYKGTPYWEGVPSKIKTALLKSQLSKHLGTQHDQKTHGRRKAGPHVVLGKDAFDSAQTAHERLRDYNRAGGYEKGLKDNIARTIGDALDKEFSEDDLRETMRLIGANVRAWSQVDPALSTLEVDEESFEKVLTGLVEQRTFTDNGIRNIFGNRVFGLVMTREELGADPQFTDEEVAMGIERLRLERDPDTGARKVMADLRNSPKASEAYGAGVSDELLGTAVEVSRPPSDKPVASWTAGEWLFSELKDGFTRGAINDLQTLAKEGNTTDVIRSASGLSDVTLGVTRTEEGRLELIAVPSIMSPLSVSGDKYTSMENLRNLGVLSISTNNGYSIADTLVRGWATSSASNTSQLLHDQVSEMFGLADFTLQSSPSTQRSRSIILDDSYYNSRTKPVIRRVAELMYENTQALLAETSGDSVTLYRGLTSDELWARAFEAADSRLSATLNVEQLPLSSWSASVSTSKEFARRGADLGAIVMGTTVPKSRIFSMPFTGLGCYAEAEFVVLGSESDPVVVFVDPQRLREAEALDIVVDSFVDSATALSEATIKKAAEGNINIDADIRNADWVKQTFDFPEVTTAKKYREEFGLEDDEALAEHIKEWKGTPYWEGIPSKIKTGLLKARLAKHLGSQHDQKTHGRRKASKAYTVRDDTYIDITYGNYKGDVSPIGWMAGEDGYDITELDAYYDDMLDVRRGDIDGHLKFIAEDAMSRWFYYGKQSVMRTIASSMMGIGHYASQGDEPYKEKFGDNVMDRVYSGDGPIELIGEHMLHTVALLRSSALAEPSEREWFRGMVVDTKSPILRMAEGDRFVMPPSSFGGHRDIGLAFTRGGPQAPSAQMAEREEASVFNIEWRDVLFRLEPGAQGTLSPSTVSRTPGGEGFPFEIVANGEFEVVSVDRPFYDYEGAEDELVEITVRQVTTYDPKTGEYVEVG